MTLLPQLVLTTLAVLVLLLSSSSSLEMRSQFLLVASVLVLLSLASAPVSATKHAHASPKHASADPVSPNHYCITFDTNVNNGSADAIQIEITRSLAPLGADRLYALLNSHFFDVSPSAFFRVVPSFVVQFGISGVPSFNNKWNALPLPDDPVLGSNTNGTLSFATAGPNTRTTQLFINMANNQRLDTQGFAPMGRVISGFHTVFQINNPTPSDSNGVDQDAYSANGYKWIEEKYPTINSIIQAKVQTGKCTPTKA